MSKEEVSKLKHDFINNSLRIEIINTMVSEALQNNEPPKEEHLKDLGVFLKNHLEYLERLSQD